MNFNPEILKKLIATFQGELEDGANELTNGLVEIERYNNDNKKRLAVIEVVFRTAHNLKGAARGLGITTVGDIAHNVESIFTTLRLSKDPIPRTTIDICLEAVDKMQSAMESYLKEAALDFDIEDLNRRIVSCLSTDLSADSAAKPVTTPNSSAPAPAASPVITESNQSTMMLDNAQTASTKMHKTDEKLAVSDSIRVPLTVIDNLSELSEEIQASKIQLDDHSTYTKNLAIMIDDFSSNWKDIAASLEDVIGNHDGSRLHKSIHVANDGIINISAAIHKLTTDINSQSNDYSRLSRSIQNEVALLRLVPAQNFLSLLPRYLRELSGILNKNVELEIKCGDVYIDKYVLEGLKDPINHILRNAIDHGIESGEVRASQGKAATGKITITVKDSGNKIYIEISDDGSGLDYERIKNKIKSQHPEYANHQGSLSDDEVQQFIFQSGFSTKNEVTDVSGRGVGLDVVRKNIYALKGTLSINSVTGKGTTFTICVPLSLSSERGVIVQSGDQIFILPTANILRIQAVDKTDIVNIEGSQAILVDGHPIVLKPLSAVLSLSHQNDSADSCSAVILQVSKYVVALAVDKIHGEREIVIKPIQDPLASIACISGATLLDRNKIAIVLNPDELINLALKTKSQYLVIQQSDAKKTPESLRILVVDDSITTRTLEKNILESKNYHVTTAVNGQEAWDILQKQTFSLIITDVNMPIMDGFSLTARIKSSEKLSHIPVIIVTSLGSDAEKAQGAEAGADAYIVKNEFESGALLQIIDQLV